jgi:cytochrome c oxidase cbb3-type subunit 1
MTMFGAMYYIVPRLVGWEWPSARMIRWHFWLAAGGIGLMFASLTLGGFFQGLELNDPQVAFLTSVQVVAPFRFVRALSGILLAGAHFVFAILFVQMLLRRGGEREGATLLAEVGSAYERKRERRSPPPGEGEVPEV